MASYSSFSIVFLLLSSIVLFDRTSAGGDWKDKKLQDYNDRDVEMLFDQWEDNDEPLPDDELPQYKRKPAGIDISKLDMSNPENVLKQSKKGQTLMVFVSVATGSRDETEQLTQLWQSSLQNNNIHCDRFMVDDHRVIYMFNDGALAWEAKDFLVDQDRCVSVTIDSKVYDGKAKLKEDKQHEEL